jgi:hypothetical protein
MSKFRLAHLGLALAALGFTAAAGRWPGPCYAAEDPPPGSRQAAAGSPATDEVRARTRKPWPKLRQLDKRRRQVRKRKLPDRAHPRSAPPRRPATTTAAKSFEALIAPASCPASEKRAVLGRPDRHLHARRRPEQGKCRHRAPAEEHDDPKLRAYLMQNYYKQGNVAALETELRNAEKSGR